MDMDQSEIVSKQRKNVLATRNCRNLTYGGNNFNDFSENQLTKFRVEQYTESSDTES